MEIIRGPKSWCWDGEEWGEGEGNNGSTQTSGVYKQEKWEICRNCEANWIKW